MNQNSNLPAIKQVTGLVDLNHVGLSRKIVEAIKNGEVNPLEVHVSLKRMEKLFEETNKDKEYKEAVENYVQRNLEGNQKSVDFHGNKIAYMAVHTSYDFSECNDPLWNAWNAILQQAQEALKQREESLKAGWSSNVLGIQRRQEFVEEIPTIQWEHNEDLVNINPPVKRQKMGTKVIFGKEQNYPRFTNNELTDL